MYFATHKFACLFKKSTFPLVLIQNRSPSTNAQTKLIPLILTSKDTNTHKTKHIYPHE